MQAKHASKACGEVANLLTKLGHNLEEGKRESVTFSKKKAREREREMHISSWGALCLTLASLKAFG